MSMKVFLDCMVFLHYRRLDELDLPSIVHADSVTVIVPRITMRELDEQKNTHRSSKIRDRARRLLKKLEIWATQQEAPRRNVSVEFFAETPTIDFFKHGLNPTWNDDQLIASVLQYKNKHAEEEVILVTQDSGPRLTAQHLGIVVAELPEECRIPSEPDPIELENRKLRNDLAKLQSALPELIVCFVDSDQPVQHANFLLPPPPEPIEEAIALRIDELRQKMRKCCPPQSSSPVAKVNPQQQLGNLSSIFDAWNAILPDEYERYNREVDMFLADYERYMRARWATDALLRRTISFQIEIRNIGTAPADDVDVELDFPAGFQLFTKDGLPSMPAEPSPPPEPRTQMGVLVNNMHYSTNLSLPTVTLPHLGMPLSFNIRRTDSYRVTDHFRRIKHGDNGLLPKLFLMFDSYDTASSFACRYVLRPVNLPDAVSGELHFVIEKGT